MTDDQGYREVLGSDVPNDGMYLELWNHSDEVVACVFRSDLTGEFEVSLGPGCAPHDTIETFIAKAKTVLSERRDA